MVAWELLYGESKVHINIPAHVYLDSPMIDWMVEGKYISSEEAKEQALNLTGLAVNKKSIIEN